MTHRRRRRGFEPVGSLPVDRLGLPKKRAREMVLAQGFLEVAGEALAARAKALRVVRGVLEIEVPEGPWAETLSQLLPTLARRLSAAHPELGLRKCRLVRGAEIEREAPRDLAPEAGTAPARPRAAAPAPSEEAPAPAGDRAERLPELARRYLARSEGRVRNHSQ